MKILCRTQNSDNSAAVRVLDALKKNRIGHVGYPETYGRCYVRKNHYGARTKGTFTDGYETPDGIKFRIRTWGDGPGAYTESTYDSKEIEFIEE